MKLKVATAIVSVVVFVGMALIVIMGIFVRKPVTQTQAAMPDGQVAISISPNKTYKNGYATISWAASEKTISCEAGGEWSGAKTVSGQESTGRLTSAGNKEYNITCKSSNGQYKASASLTVTE
jgi:hypothetical protein